MTLTMPHFLNRKAKESLSQRWINAMELFDLVRPPVYDEYKESTERCTVRGRPIPRYENRMPPELCVNLPELKKLAKAKDIPGYKTMKKAALQAALS